MTVTIRFLLLPLPSMLLLFLAKFLPLREHIGLPSFTKRMLINALEATSSRESLVCFL